MPIAKITGQGLAAIAASVALLWACFVGERVILNQSYACRAQVIRDLRQMQLRHTEQPVSLPAVPHPSHSTVG
jgi:hypothetical protein